MTLNQTAARAARALLDLSGEDRDDNLIPCYCDMVTEDACPRCDVDGADEFDLDLAARTLSLALGVPAYVENTGGGCMAIMVGPGQIGPGEPGYDGTGSQPTPVLSAGPGSAVGSSLEFSIGAAYDRFGEAVYADGLTSTMPEWHANPVAWLVGQALSLYPRTHALPVVAATAHDL